MLRAILRSHNEPKLLDVIHRLEQTHFVKEVYVAVNLEKNPLDSASVLESYSGKMNIIACELDEFGWSSSLNECLKRFPKPSGLSEMVLIVSNEVEFTRYHIHQLVDAANKRNASCGYSTFYNRREPSYLVPRNTFIVWRREIFENSGLFDESLDNDTGMEDFDMALRAYRSQGLLPFRGPAEVAVNLNKRLDFRAKLAWENRGLEKIKRRFTPQLVSSFLNHLASQNRS